MPSRRILYYLMAPPWNVANFTIHMALFNFEMTFWSTVLSWQWWHRGACELWTPLRVCVELLFPLPCCGSASLCTDACELDCKDWTSLSASFIVCGISYALANVNAFSANNLCWVYVLCNPDTNLLLNISLTDSPKSQSSVSLWSSAT